MGRVLKLLAFIAIFLSMEKTKSVSKKLNSLDFWKLKDLTRKPFSFLFEPLNGLIVLLRPQFRYKIASIYSAFVSRTNKNNCVQRRDRIRWATLFFPALHCPHLATLSHALDVCTPTVEKIIWMAVARRLGAILGHTFIKLFPHDFLEILSFRRHIKRRRSAENCLLRNDDWEI